MYWSRSVPATRRPLARPVLLASESVGHEETDNGMWDDSFGPLKLGRTDERILRIEKHKRRTVMKGVSPMSLD